MRVLLIIAGVVLAAVGGVIAYQAAFVAAPTAFVVNESSGSVHEVHSVGRIAGGVLLLIAGAGLAFFAARRRA
jgi:Sec-independent protein secretion pathway component TatC